MTGCRLGLLAVVGLLLSGCVGVTVTPTPGPAASTTAPSSAPVTAAASTTPTLSATASTSPTAAAINLYLRSWTVAPLGPATNFGFVPLVISDGQYLTVRHTATAAPYPLFERPTRRAISQAGLAMIVAEAQADGLVGSVTSFDCPDDENVIVAGGPGPDYVEMVVNGVRHELSSSCPDAGAIPTPTIGTPAPGTWAAFQRFNKLLSNPSSWLGSEIGPAVVYDPDTLVVLAIFGETPGPVDAIAWPLTKPFASFGVGWEGFRCALVSGADEDALLPVVKSAYAESVFRDADGALADLIVRAFMPGEPDLCAAGWAVRAAGYIHG